MHRRHAAMDASPVIATSFSFFSFDLFYEVLFSSVMNTNSDKKTDFQESEDFPTRFDHSSTFDKWYTRWKDSGAFKADSSSNKKHFSIVIPPPNVTGALHMGHALNNTIQDIYARYHRMLGDDVLWLPGTDHAGIATQNVVEKQLAKENITRETLGRTAFIEKVWKWKEESGGTIVKQLQRLGSSCDWSRERFTMDEGLSRAVIEVFVKLHEEGLIYRADRLINWCPRCRTALSDIEVEHEEKLGGLWYIKYPFEDGSGFVVIATTRPETMLGDTAVAVNPDDERYDGLVGKTLILPLVGRRISIIEDSYVDREFGTGAVKITPSHDPNDYEIGKRHGLLFIKAFTETGRIAETILTGAQENSIAKDFIGMSLDDCRKTVVAKLEEEGLLEKTEKYTHNVGHCYRCKTVIEPYLTPQWFVRTAPLAESAIKAVEEKKMRIVPEYWTKTYFEWMRNIRDWCISRQIWWGHRIPAWYCKKCNDGLIRELGSEKISIAISAKPIVSITPPSKCPDCGSEDLLRDPDVLDTWFSSALWPFSTLGWPDKTKDLSTYYPTSLLVTGFDILFFWVARMMMMGLKFMDEVPFKDVYIHALVRDSEGKKMSKSRGNVIDPLSVIDELGADAFRFTLAAFCAQGRDIKLDEKRIEGYRNFVTKIWNAARLVNSCKNSDLNPQKVYHAEDNWILSRLARTVSSVKIGLDNYQIDRASSAIYEFFWHEFCDWYLEIVKFRLRNGDSAAVEVSHAVLMDSLKLLHPFMPFVTDELNERMGGKNFLDMENFPQSGNIDEESEKILERVITIVTEIRKIRSEFKIAPSIKIDMYLVGDKSIMQFEEWISRLAGIQKFELVEERPALTHFAATIAAGYEIFIPLEGLIDIEKEKMRLLKEIEKCEKHIESSEKRLNDSGFISKADSSVVESARKTLDELKNRKNSLEEFLRTL